MQTIIVFTAMVLGFGYSYFLGGFEFYTTVCFFAGVFLITPVLFKFQFSDFSLLAKHKTILAKNLIINFILLPLAAVGIGVLSGDFGIAGALLLLSLLAGGGMVMHWIKTSGANIKLGFVIFFLNMALLSFSFIIFDYFSTSEYILSLFNETAKMTTLPINPIGVFNILVLLPLILSRLILRFSPSFPLFVEKYKSKISSFAIFVIVFYLFALESSSALINLDIIIIIKSLLAISSFYIISYVIASVFYGNNQDDNAGFWHTITRFITIALVVATYAVEIYGYSFLVPIMMAYFIQIPLAINISKIKKV